MVMAYSNRISVVRRAAGLSQGQLADKVESTLSMIGKLERGERELTQTWVEKIAKAVGCEPIEVLYAPEAPILIGTVSPDGAVSNNDGIWADLEALDEFDPTAAGDPRMDRDRAVKLTGVGHINLPINCQFIVRLRDVEMDAPAIGKLAFIDVSEDGAGDAYLGTPMAGSKPERYHIQLINGQIVQDTPISWSLPVRSIIFP